MKAGTSHSVSNRKVTRKNNTRLTRRNARGIAILFSAAAVAWQSQSTHAATFTWDPGMTPAAPTGGAGTWDLATANWSNGTGDIVFIEASHLNNIEISGGGTIDGQGSPWWAAQNGGTLTQRRPQMIAIDSCNIVLIEGVTLTNPPNTHISLQNSCNDCIVQNVTINTPSPSPNTDGIDVSGTNMIFRNLNISCGDDNLVFGAGATSGGPETANIIVNNCTFGAGHGLSIGSYTSGGVQNIAVSNCSFNGTVSGIRMKSERGRGGLISNISYYNITMTNVEFAIDINSYYNQGSVPSTPMDPPQPINLTPVWQNITISNLTSTTSSSQSNYSGSYCGIIWGLPEAPAANITLSNVSLSARHGFDLNHDTNIAFDGKCVITPHDGGGDLVSTTSAPTPYQVTVEEEGYTDTDIGSPTTVGDTLFDPNTGLWTITAGGTGIGGTSDQFNLMSESETGNATYFAKVASQTNSNSAAAAGVMFRDSTNAATAAFADAVVTPGSGVQFQWRNANNGTVGSASIAGIVAPIWVEITRTGNSFSAFYSTNGTNWTQIGTAQTITMSSTALVGLAVAANSSTATSTATFTNLAGAPITTDPASSPQPVTGTTANLSATATEAGSTLTYNWTLLQGPSGATAPTLSVNNSTTAKNTTATFFAPGIYEFLLTVTDSNNIATSAVLGVGVNQTPTGVTVSPATATLGAGSPQLYTASATDQFGVTFEPVFAWTVSSGAGSVDPSFGLFTAGSTNGTSTIKATAGSASGTATATVILTVAQAAAANPNPAQISVGTTLSALGAENGADTGLAYTWSSSGPAAVTYTGSTNGTNAAKNITPIFSVGGTYNFTVTIADASGRKTTSGVAVVVNSFAVQSGSTLNITLSNIGPVSLAMSGSNVIATQNGKQLTFSGVTSIVVTDSGSGDVLNFNNVPATPLSFTSTGTATINVNSGAMTFAAVPGGSINIGSLAIASGASAILAASTTPQPTTLNLNNLSIASNGNFNVGNNIVVLSYGAGPDPISSIAAEITSGYNSGAWNGSGINSSNAAANASSYGLGYADSADPGNPAALASNTIMIRYTLLGDADLNGTVNGIDFGIFAANLNKSVSYWDQGDFNYDGIANGIDFGLLSVNLNQAVNIDAGVIAQPSQTVATPVTTVATPAPNPTPHHRENGHR
jgi:hypothetical protein